MTRIALLALAAAAIALPVAAQSGAQTGVISKDGVRLLGQDRLIAFGEAEAAVIDHVTGVVGAPPALSQAQACRNGVFAYADWGQGLRLAFQDGRFVGWRADRRLAPGYSNRAGVTFGRTVAAMRAENAGLILADAVQGREFVLDGVHGRVLTPGQDATVDLLWAGADCRPR